MTAGLAADQIYRNLKRHKMIAQTTFMVGLISTPIAAIANVFPVALVCAILALAGFLVAREQPTDERIERWNIGAKAEAETSKRLSAVRADGFKIFEDVRLPAMRGNIDHLVIGPTGVWLLNTKQRNPRWPIQRRGSEWQYGSYPLADMVDPDVRLAAVLTREIVARAGFRLEVFPAWVLYGPRIPAGLPSGSAGVGLKVGPVRIVSPDDLSRLILHGSQVLTWDQVGYLDHVLKSMLRSAAA